MAAESVLFFAKLRLVSQYFNANVALPEVMTFGSFFLSPRHLWPPASMAERGSFEFVLVLSIAVPPRAIPISPRKRALRPTSETSRSLTPLVDPQTQQEPLILAVCPPVQFSNNASRTVTPPFSRPFGPNLDQLLKNTGLSCRMSFSYGRP